MTNTALTPLETVRKFLAAMAIKDYETGLEFIAADCEYTNVPLATVTGPLGVRGVIEPFFAPTLENIFEEKHVLADGPVVFMERLDRHRLADKWVELPINSVWEVSDGKITIWRDYFDAATIMDQWPQAA